jgi:hypothetical protein
VRAPAAPPARAPLTAGARRLPYIDAPAFEWYPAFDALAEPLAHPDPTPALGPLLAALTHLVRACAWPPARIHLLGFGQGGTAALELALHVWRTPGALAPADGAARTALGSVVSVAGPLLSFPTTLPAPCTTPVLFLSPATAPPPPLARAFAGARAVRGPPGERMPASRAEWEPVMRFWGEHLGRRVGGEGLYEVLGGTAG